MKRNAILPLAVLLVSLFVMPFTAEAAKKPQISAQKSTIAVGNTKTLKMKNTKGKVTWKSSKPSIAKVSGKGVVTAMKKGSATITAKVSKKKYSCKVTVTAAKLNAGSITLDIGKSKALKFTNSKGKVSWSSSNKAVAKVSSGKVTGLKAGKAVISAKIGGSVYKCNVTVKNPNVAAEILEFTVADGGDFVCGNSSASIRFSMKNTAYGVTVQVVDSLGAAVYKAAYEKCNAGKTYTLTWTPEASTSIGSYRVRVKAGSQESYSEYLSLKKAGVFAGGNGSEKNPYLVSTLAQFQAIELNNGFYYKQINDIDGGQEMVSGIYSMDNPFTGNYDGGGYAIRNLILKNGAKSEMALFGSISEKGSLKNVNLANIDTIGAYGYAGLLSLQNKGVISNCSVTDCTINDTNNGGIGAAFLCLFNEESGLVSGCSVKNCSASLNASPWDVCTYAGGLLVDNHGKLMDCTVENMDLFAQLSSTGGGNRPWCYLSALVRWNDGLMQNCSASGASIDSSWHNHSSVGGICELNEGVIRSCSFSGTASNEGIGTDKGSVF